jgi:glyceraldehyde 3-phosphate dehydrogenase
MRIAINGFGRIGKTFLRTLLQDVQVREKITVVGINIGPGNLEDQALLFKYDSVMGTYPGLVTQQGAMLHIDEYAIPLTTALDPLAIPSRQWDVDWMVECSGRFTKREAVAQHLKAGAKKVLISAPATQEDVTIIPGINYHAYDHKRHALVSLGSCTTNALVPAVFIVQRAFGITQAFMTTTHAYTNTQVLLDVDIGDPRRNRAAALNMVPTTTGATDVIGKIMPELKGLISGHAIRVPVPKVSLIDLTFQSPAALSVDALNNAFKKACQGPLKGIVRVTHEPLVSTDFAGDPHSFTLDAELTQVIGNTGKIFGWYDNEWGYSSRLKDFLLFADSQ